MSKELTELNGTHQNAVFNYKPNSICVYTNSDWFEKILSLWNKSSDSCKTTSILIKCICPQLKNHFSIKHFSILVLLFDRCQGQYYFYKDIEMKTASLVLAGLISSVSLSGQVWVSHTSLEDVFNVSTSPQTTWLLTKWIAPLIWMDLCNLGTVNRNKSSSIYGLKHFLYSTAQTFDKPSTLWLSNEHNRTKKAHG